MQHLLIAKLHAFGFGLKSLRVIHAYLKDRIQVPKVGSFYSENFQIIYGVPQGWIIGPLLFNVNLIDLLLPEHYKSDFSNYADDTAPYNCSSTFLEIISVVEITYATYLTGSATIILKQMPQNAIYFYRLVMQNALKLKVLY